MWTYNTGPIRTIFAGRSNRFGVIMPRSPVERSVSTLEESNIESNHIDDNVSDTSSILSAEAPGGS